jgi:hypothetical protein
MLVLFDQRHLGLDGSGDVGGDQAGAAGADDDQVAVETSRLLPRGEDLVRAADVDDLARDQRKDAEQGKRAEQAGRKNAGERVDLCQLRAGIHIHHRAGQHAELADPVEGAGLHAGQAGSAD